MPKQDSTKIISGKDLGQLAIDTFCLRCFWYERKYGKAPGIFPGIFSTLDSISKKSTKRSFLEAGKKPGWLSIEGIKRPIEFPRIHVIVNHGDWILTGVPDDVFEREDKGYHIVDYKTAKYTGTQDRLLPMYEVQLNAYAYALPYHGIKPITHLSLIYCEPNENIENDQDFKLGFTTKVLHINLNTDMIPPLLIKARKILDSTEPPEPYINCKGICMWLDSLYGKK